MDSITPENSSREFDALRQILLAQKLGVLATIDGSQPYSTLVGFSVSSDLKSLFFSTPRTTRKFAHIMANDRVSMTIDNRSSIDADFFDAVGITVCGWAAEYERSLGSRFLKQYIAKHPYLEEFVLSPQCAFLRVYVEKYVIVRRFQQVVELTVR